MKKYGYLLIALFFSLHSGNGLFRMEHSEKGDSETYNYLSTGEHLETYKDFRSRLIKEGVKRGTKIDNPTLKGVRDMLLEGIHCEDSKTYIRNFDTFLKNLDLLPEQWATDICNDLEKKNGFLVISVEIDGRNKFYGQDFNESRIDAALKNRALNGELSSPLEEFKKMLEGQKKLHNVVTQEKMRMKALNIQKREEIKKSYINLFDELVNSKATYQDFISKFADARNITFDREDIAATMRFFFTGVKKDGFFFPKPYVTFLDVLAKNSQHIPEIWAQQIIQDLQRDGEFLMQDNYQGKGRIRATTLERAFEQLPTENPSKSALLFKELLTKQQELWRPFQEQKREEESRRQDRLLDLSLQLKAMKS